MDFIAREDDFEVLVERQKERVKNQILTSYIKKRKRNNPAGNCRSYRNKAYECCPD